MKKSQILAALALAFALGVVAPVASTSVFAAEPATIAVGAETNTEAEVKAAIRRIESYGEYKKYAAVYRAIEVVSNNGTDVNKVEEADDAFDALQTAANDIKANAITAGTSLRDAIAIANGVETTQKNEAWNKLYKAMEDKNATAAQMLSAIQGVDGGYNNPDGYTTASQYKAFVNGTTWTISNTTVSGNDLYTKYVALFEAIDDATKTRDALNALETALNNVQDWSKIAGKEDSVEDAVDNVNGTPIVNLMGLVADVKGWSQYAALIGAVDEANDEKTASESGKNAQLITAMENALKAATLAVSGTALKINDLPAVPADGNQGDGTNKPGQQAPDTGIVAGTEGSASTTVAMVAGIATALTAAGAGVVAYRNARRSSRK